MVLPKKLASQTEDAKPLEDEIKEMTLHLLDSNIGDLHSSHVGQCQTGFQSFKFWVCETKDTALAGGKSLKTSARGRRETHANLTGECSEARPSVGLNPTSNGVRRITIESVDLTENVYRI